MDKKKMEALEMAAENNPEVSVEEIEGEMGLLDALSDEANDVEALLDRAALSEKVAQKLSSKK